MESVNPKNFIDIDPYTVSFITLKDGNIMILNKVAKIDAFTSHQIKFTVSPDNATNKKVGFTSSNPTFNLFE